MPSAIFAIPTKMSPFKVVRCRYFDLDGNAVAPYCTLGRHCTFLHPGDKGWPGGEPAAPDPNKRFSDKEKSPISLRLGSSRTFERFLNHTHTTSPARMGAVIDVLSDVSEQRTNGSRKIPPVPAIIKTFQDIAKAQMRLTQDKDKIDKNTEKLAAFKELSKTLSKFATLNTSAINPTLDAIVKTQQDLKLKYEEDTKHLSELWDDALHIFLRAICHQFDLEIESGTDYLRQEVRILFKSLKSQSESQRQPTSVPLDSPSLPKVDSEDIGDSSGVNPPIGLSDNGWSRKRPRRDSSTQSENEEEAARDTNATAKEIIVKLQARLDNQEKRIDALVAQSQKLEILIQEYGAKNSIWSSISSPTTDCLSLDTMGETLISRHIEPILEQRIMAILNPVLEAQKIDTGILEAQLLKLEEGMRSLQVMKQDSTTNNDISMESSTPLQSPAA
ncbi:hypothetical protein M422DRAFT_252382 [Sphaerobolus stellatus SS14]|uniref:C3H1-type domain-containing protein n=1 Tax=Sphaerobolus stellatus (strain SS14) TaxID=990650 RepID=A0A0C9VBP1_SPHS4|nr:hypothetical protein M422DRAFT_252382 [Sphaerobolus stellatus SS14]